MLTSTGVDKVYLACGSTDMRKSIDALAVMVQAAFDLDPFSPSLFVFCNKERDRLKILQWDHNGFWLYYRRLERGRFAWPMKRTDEQVLTISRRQLQWLLDGLTIEQPQAHLAVTARTIV